MQNLEPLRRAIESAECIVDTLDEIGGETWRLEASRKMAMDLSQILIDWLAVEHAVKLSSINAAAECPKCHQRSRIAWLCWNCGEILGQPAAFSPNVEIRHGGT